MADLLHVIERAEVSARSEIIQESAGAYNVRRYLNGKLVGSSDHYNVANIDELRRQEQQWTRSVEILT